MSQDESGFKPEDIQKVLDSNQADANQPTEADLITVTQADIIPGLPLPSDVFVKLPTGRFVMVAKKGSKSSLHDLHVAEKNQTMAFYVRKLDYLHCVDQNVKIANILAKKNDISTERKTEFLKTALDSVFKEIEFLGFQPQTLAQSKATISSVMSIIKDKDDYVKLLQKVNELPGNIVKDAVAVSALAVLIGRKMGWENSATLEKLAMGGLLRDVGLKEIPPEILEKNRRDMSADERITWETHPYRGAEILRSIPGMPVEVVAMTLEHHENALGMGFPRRVRDFKMNQFSKIICLADAFVDLTLKRDDDHFRSPVEAVHHLEYVMGMPYNKSAMLALKKALELDDHSLLAGDKKKAS